MTDVTAFIEQSSTDTDDQRFVIRASPDAYLATTDPVEVRA